MKSAGFRRRLNMTIVIHMPNSEGRKFEVENVTIFSVSDGVAGRIEYYVPDRGWFVVNSSHPHIDIR